MQSLRLRHGTLDWSAARLIGVLNLTPDSLSDGGRVGSVDGSVEGSVAAALAHATRLVSEGAVIVDVGGESTRPGATPITAGEEQARVLPALAAIAERCDVSIDTYHADTAARAVAAGACLVNDVSGGRLDPAMLPTVARLGVPIILGHLRGAPATMQQGIHFDKIVDEVVKELDDRRAAAEHAGIAPDKILLDPGLGFGKEAAHSWALLAALPRLAALGCPLVIGASRKGFLGTATGRAPQDRDAATAAVTALVAATVPALIRVHDPASQRDALAVGNALRGAPG